MGLAKQLDEGIVRRIVREETTDLRRDVAELKEDIGHLGVKFEAFDHKMDAIAELITTTVQTRTDVTTLKDRIERLETDVRILKIKPSH